MSKALDAVTYTREALRSLLTHVYWLFGREVRDTSRVTLPRRTREGAITVGGSLVAPPWCNSHRNGSIFDGFVTAVRVVDYLLLRQRL